MEQKPMMPYPKGFLRWVLLFPVQLYRLGFGEVLKLFNIMVLGVRGRSSGLARYVPVEFRRHGSKLYVVSGWGEQPQWFRNLLANPLATVQIGGHTQRVRARVVEDRAEALRVLNLFRRSTPLVSDAVLARLSTGKFDLKTLPDISHQFTIMRLDIEEGASPVPPVRRDLAWILPGIVLAGMALMSLRLLRQRTEGEP
ncbi:MAG: nitroreductase family deazaflavin-dependent oxidoreductase [Anaerolineae bacterium]